MRAMRIFIELRACDIAEYIVENKCTVRDAAAHFGISKSTVFLDVTKRIRKVYPEIYMKVCEVLSYNKSQRHLRGGEATKLKYRREKSR